MTSDVPAPRRRRAPAPAEPTPSPPLDAKVAPTPAASPEPATPAMRLQILSTEHWSLLASRNLAWSEAFTRAGMFLSTLSFAVVALALVAQATAFGEGFRLFALVILPVVLFLGIATQLRLDSANHHDAICVVGMNRIRATYVELAPDLERVFVMGTTDDLRGIITTMAVVPNRSFVANLLSAIPVQVGALNAVLVAAIGALIAIQLGANTATTIAVGGLAFILGVGAFLAYARRLVQRTIADYRPMFPGRPDPADEAQQPTRPGR